MILLLRQYRLLIFSWSHSNSIISYLRYLKKKKSRLFPDLKDKEHIFLCLPLYHKCLGINIMGDLKREWKKDWPHQRWSTRRSRCRGCCTWWCPGSVGCSSCCSGPCRACTAFPSPSGIRWWRTTVPGPWRFSYPCLVSHTWKIHESRVAFNTS